MRAATAFITFGLATFSVYILAQSNKQFKKASMASSGVILQRNLDTSQSTPPQFNMVYGILHSHKFLDLEEKPVPKDIEKLENSENLKEFIEEIQCGETPAIIKDPSQKEIKFFMNDFADILNKAMSLPSDQLNEAETNRESAISLINKIEDGSISRETEKGKLGSVTSVSECPLHQKTGGHNATQTKPPTITTSISSKLSSAHPFPNSTTSRISTASSSLSRGSKSTVAAASVTSIRHQNSAGVSMRTKSGTYRSKEFWACSFMIIIVLGLSLSF